jgi:hypothetical protein
MALFPRLPGSSRPPVFPSGCYRHTNPLRRQAGLRVLTTYLPEPLRWAVIRAWRQPSRFEVGMTALPSPHRQRPGDAFIARAAPGIIAYIALTEMEVSRRIVEAPQVSLTAGERDSLLIAQSLYLRLLYEALTRQIGEAAALAEFQRLLLSVG